MKEIREQVKDDFKVMPFASAYKKNEKAIKELEKVYGKRAIRSMCQTTSKWYKQP